MRLFIRRSSSFNQASSSGSVAATPIAPFLTPGPAMKHVSRVGSVRNFLQKRFGRSGMTKNDDSSGRTLEKSLSEGALQMPRSPLSRSSSPDREAILARMRRQKAEIDASLGYRRQRFAVIEHLENMRRILRSAESSLMTEAAARLVDLEDEPLPAEVMMRCGKRHRVSEGFYSDYCSNRSSTVSTESRNSLDAPRELAEILRKLNSIAPDTNSEAESGYDSDSTRATDSANSSPRSSMSCVGSELDESRSSLADVSGELAASLQKLNLALDPFNSSSDRESAYDSSPRSSSICAGNEVDLDATLPVSDDEEDFDDEDVKRSSSFYDRSSRSTCEIVEALTKDGRVVSESEMLGEEQQQQQQRQQLQLTGMTKFFVRKRTLSSILQEVSSTSSKVFTVELDKSSHPDASLGFSIVGGSNYSKPITVKQIFEGGRAQSNGELSFGDEILAVNGLTLKHLTHDQAARAIRSAQPGKVVLHVARK